MANAPTVPPTPTDTTFAILTSLCFAAAMFSPVISDIMHFGEYTRTAFLLLFLLPLVLMIFTSTAIVRCIQASCVIIAIITFPLWTSLLLHIQYYDTFEIGKAVTRISALTTYIAIIIVLLYHPFHKSILYFSFAILSIFLTLLFIIASMGSPEWHYDRFMPAGFHPNWWGQNFFALTFAASFFSRRVLRFAFWIFALIGFVLVESRASMLAAIFIMFLATLQHEGTFRFIVIGLSVIFIVVPITILLDHSFFNSVFYNTFRIFMEEEILKLNDPYRGLGTGLTGRDDTWEAGLRVVFEQPFLGVGFGRANIVAQEYLRTEGLIHNGHLMLMGDLGIFLYFVLIIIIFGATSIALIDREYIDFGMLSSFSLFYMMIEPRAINMGVVPMLFWMTVTRVWVRAGLRVGADPNWRSVSRRAEKRRSVGVR